ncbi:hypothetical protein [Cerasicoccus arenae]|uniref:Polymerase/histidinol phosphatase N-terminal domain-containing protein n=1 Tax=Cerasicoccus arenae TaxID=424488 RepID=A0A8J3GCC3_9BACT|nr:hypothetical protein [Cerasicoccus arenae]MBK1859356.1 hypothetical protein [Cerasicoccus arenae]GHB93352.1 hypothetical protein GCM10007047_05930 [Cerasicoccus arenae]
MSTSYSNWFRVDLHIHTDWSKKTKIGDYNGTFTVAKLHEKLTGNQVAVFSLTDHNIINIDAYKEYYSAYSEEQNPLLLVGVELDIILESSSTVTYHTLIIFNLCSADGAQRVHDALEQKYSERGLEATERVLTMTEVIEIFPDDDFFFIPHAGSNKSIITPYRENIRAAQQMIILMQSAMEKVKEQRRHEYNLRFNDILTEAFKNRNDHAYIEFSDNHCIEAYPCTGLGEDAVEHSFYYLKGRKSFETLRQAFIDPQSRIRSSQQFSSIRPSQRHLQALEIDPHGILAGQTVTFSPHLNVVIGGRSSGKSLFLSMLGQKIDSIQNRANTNYPIKTDRVKIRAVQDGGLTLQTSIEARRLTYIGQGEIVNYFEHGNLSRLANSTGASSDYETSKKAFAEHRQDLDSKVEDLLSAYKKSTLLSGEKFILHKSTLDHLFGDSFTFTWDDEKVREKCDFTDPINDAGENISDLLIQTEAFRDDPLFGFTSQEEDLIQSFIELVERKKTGLEKVSSDNASTLVFLQSVDQIVSSRNAELDEGARLKAEARIEVRELKSRVAERFQNLSDLNSTSREVSSFNYSKAEEIGLNNGINLVLEVEPIPGTTVQSLITDGIKDADNSKSLFLVLLDVLAGNCLIKHHGGNSAESLEKKILSQLEPIYDHLNSPSDHLNYADGETSKSKSPGYNSEKYLEIVLRSAETELIVIDQPEDNLGNAFIAERLVELIREIKFQKQVFLVTHNPSIVVHGDAENIIIATNENGIVTYSQVVIEDKSSQKVICKILDGGEYIFDKRSKKYNIERILREHEREK